MKVNFAKSYFIGLNVDGSFMEGTFHTP